MGGSGRGWWRCLKFNFGTAALNLLAFGVV